MSKTAGVLYSVIGTYVRKAPKSVVISSNRLQPAKQLKSAKILRGMLQLVSERAAGAKTDRANEPELSFKCHSRLYHHLKSALIDYNPSEPHIPKNRIGLNTSFALRLRCYIIKNPIKLHWANNKLN